MDLSQVFCIVVCRAFVEDERVSLLGNLVGLQLD